MAVHGWRSGWPEDIEELVVDSIADDLAAWAVSFSPTEDDLSLAERAAQDTVAVAIAARDEDILRIAAGQPEFSRWAIASHILDFDDLHMESTTHVSTVCLPVALATGGGALSFLAGAGVMTRIGNALGWEHYSAGWHATATAGAFGATVAAGISFGLNRAQMVNALSLAVPAAGGVQRAFGTDGKSLQIGFAAAAGVRAARLAAAGAHGDGRALDEWLALVGGHADRIELDGPAVPGGLAIKMYPCCYAMQRPISLLRSMHDQLADPTAVQEIILSTPESTLQPLIHDLPSTGLEGKFSMQYAAAVALLDAYPGFASFTDAAVRRPEAQELMKRVRIESKPGGDWLLSGTLIAELNSDAEDVTSELRFPPGSPERPPTTEEMYFKVRDCLTGTGIGPEEINWDSAADLLRQYLVERETEMAK